MERNVLNDVEGEKIERLIEKLTSLCVCKL